MSRLMGRFVTETLDYNGGRQVTAYVPASPPEAIVFAGDGQLIASWGVVLEAARVLPTMVVGAHGLDDETLRLHEYVPGESTAAFAFDLERFTAHETFFVEEVRAWARSRFGVVLPAERTAVFGVSASGELALAMGLRHPDIYGAVFLRLAGWWVPPSCSDAESASAHVSGCRNAGAVLPRERDPVGEGVARCGGGRCYDRAGRITRRRILARRVPADGGVGIWWLNIDRNLSRRGIDLSAIPTGNLYHTESSSGNPNARTS
jgi:hypothetical protein